MRLTRALVATAFAAAALGGMPAASATHDCDQNPNTHCYECVRYPCYPEDYPPYLIGLIFGDGDR